MERYKHTGMGKQPENVNCFADFIEKYKPCLDQRYIIALNISSGAFGEVAKAFDINLQEIVALKMFKSGYMYDESAKREIAFLSILYEKGRGKPPNVVKFYDAFLSKSGCWNIVMELLGPDLESFLKNSKEPLTKVQLIDIAKSLVEGIKFVHSCNIVHCDLKLSNVAIGPRGNLCCKVSNY